MKKEVSKPILISSIVIVVAIIGAVFFFTSETKELPAGKKLPGYTDDMPDYIKNAKSGKPGLGDKVGGDLSGLSEREKAEIQKSISTSGGPPQ